MHFLEPMLQHRTVHLVQQSLIDPDDQVRSDSQETSVKRGVMDLAESHAIGHHRGAVIRCLSDDMRSIEELHMFESTDRATRSVSMNDALAEEGLMEPLSGEPSGVDPF